MPKICMTFVSCSFWHDFFSTRIGLMPDHFLFAVVVQDFPGFDDSICSAASRTPRFEFLTFFILRRSLWGLGVTDPGSPPTHTMWDWLD